MIHPHKRRLRITTWENHHGPVALTFYQRRASNLNEAWQYSMCKKYLSVRRLVAVSGRLGWFTSAVKQPEDNRTQSDIANEVSQLLKNPRQPYKQIGGLKPEWRV